MIATLLPTNGIRPDFVAIKAGHKFERIKPRKLRPSKTVFVASVFMKDILFSTPFDYPHIFLSYEVFNIKYTVQESSKLVDLK
jgi:hypothetical protein